MTTEIIPFKEPRALASLATKSPAVFLPNEKAAELFFGLFAANIRNKDTRRAYYKAACRLSDWCENRGLLDVADVKPPHVAEYIEMLGPPRSPQDGEPCRHPHDAALRPARGFGLAR
jgi:hypothetical protein